MTHAVRTHVLLTSVLLSLGAMLATPGNVGAITQPDGETIPAALACSAGEPNGLAAIFACACLEPATCNIGAPCPSDTSCDDGENGTCETTLWHSFNDNTCIPSNQSGLDPNAAASLSPETFWPSGPLTFTLRSRGSTPFGDAFGWYNATSSAPSSSDLHVVLDCNASVGTTVTLDLCQDPDYQGGPVGFFLLTPQSHTSVECDSFDCCASLSRLGAGAGYAYYSASAFNPDSTGEDSYIHLLLFPSRILEHRTYFAWEDQYASGGTGTFTQLVVAVDGLQADSAGNACAAGPDAGTPDASTAGGDAAGSPDAEAGPDASSSPDAEPGADAASPPDTAVATSVDAFVPPDAALASADASTPGDAASAADDAGQVVSDATGCSCGSRAGTPSFAWLALATLVASASKRRKGW